MVDSMPVSAKRLALSRNPAFHETSKGQSLYQDRERDDAIGQHDQRLLLVACGKGQRERDGNPAVRKRARRPTPAEEHES